MALQIERVLDSFFEFSLNGGDVVSDSAPSVTFINNLCHFKTKNGANIVKEQNILVSDVTVIDTFGGSGTFNYNNPASLFLKLLDLNFFQDRVSAVSGVTNFAQLLDAFNYFGNNGKVPVVNEEQSKLVPTTFYNFNQLTQMSDVSVSDLVKGKYLKVDEVKGELKFVLADVNTTTTESKLKKLTVIAEENQSTISVDNSPVAIFLYKNGQWQIEGQDFTYSTGDITPLGEVFEGDYFEIIPLSNGINKQLVTATSDNQTEFSFDGNPSYADAYLKGTRLREGVDYTRTLFSNNNKIVIINQYLIDDIATGDIVEIITY